MRKHGKTLLNKGLQEIKKMDVSDLLIHPFFDVPYFQADFADIDNFILECNKKKVVYIIRKNIKIF